VTPPVRWLALALFLACAAPAPAPAQDWLLLNGIADGEAWVTDSASTLLSRNAGQFATLGRVQLFAAAAVRPTLQLIFMGEIEGGDATDADNELEIGYDQLVLRYIPSLRAVIDVGKFPSPVGAFANRRLSTTNPLIGSPDGYAVTYPWGIEVSGAISHFDYRAALVSLPVTHEDYVPDPSPALRPVLGGGYTPVPELRLGASLTWGPYLNSDLGAALPAGADWKTYTQRVLGIDARLTIGYFEFRGEVLLSRYDVPTRSSALEAVDVYAEAKQTWAPRLFTAARFERNDYALVVPDSAGPWSGRLVDSYNGEVGVGYRLSAGTTLKASYRRAWWRVALDLPPGMPDGYAFGLQLSCHGDINGWFERKR
jgi:hypothetical protein